MKRFVFFAALLLLWGCNSPEVQNLEMINDSFAPAKRYMSSVPVAETPEVSPQDDVVKNRIIKDGRVGIKVGDIAKAKVWADTLLKRHRGYYSNESFNNTEIESSYNLRIRVPQEEFERFIAALESGNGEILYKEIYARDVTEQFIDLETRLESKRGYLSRYAELLKRAGSVKDILEIEERIRVLQEEIESTTGRLKYLTDQVAYSSLELNITKRNEYKFSPESRDSFYERLKRSLFNGWTGMVDVALLIIKLWPLWAAFLLATLFIKKLKKDKKNKKLKSVKE